MHDNGQRTRTLIAHCTVQPVIWLVGCCLQGTCPTGCTRAHSKQSRTAKEAEGALCVWVCSHLVNLVQQGWVLGCCAAVDQVLLQCTHEGVEAAAALDQQAVAGSTLHACATQQQGAPSKPSNSA